MRRSFVRLRAFIRITAVVLCIGLAAESWAQSAPASPPVSAAPPLARLDLFGGLTLLRTPPGPDLDRTGLAGWQASLTFYPATGEGFRSRLGLAAEVGGAHRTPPLDDAQVAGTYMRLTQHTILGGPVLRMVRRERVSTNVRVLVGIANLRTAFPSDRTQAGIGPGQTPGSIGVFEDATAFALSFGTAWEIRLAPRVALRVNPSLLLTQFGSDTQRTLRLSTGLVFRWQHGQGR